jgi:nitrate/TMAO reductase-like tetraheme cytochrome c subunit
MNKNLLSVIFILLILFYKNLFPQISPGDLTKAHANLEGLGNCTKCHVLGQQVYNSKCLDCHKEIDKLIKQNTGYHASSEVKGKDCWSCHSEHHGRNFRIINFSKDNFNHNKTGFELTGSHRKLDCNDCHSNKSIKDVEIRKRVNTYLGLEKNCSSCHKDFHQGTLSSNCSDCHNTEKFKPAVSFDHDKAAFKLAGSHRTVNCIKCHPVEERKGEKFQKFKGIAFANCSSCHIDAHQGKFGVNCTGCHNTNSFKQINQSAFDHDKTNFPLIGKHNFVSCNDCHKGKITDKIMHERCNNCHADYHKGQFISDCSVCHNETGFLPSTYTIDRHNQSQFKLTGGHLAAPCVNCHLKEGEWHFKNIGTKCIDCHKNVHGQEIKMDFMANNNCSECHNTENWNTISFVHDRTDFKLLGKHLNVSCTSCHYKEFNNGNKEFRFASLGNNCEVCHKDIHYGQFVQDESSNCERCHSFDNWKPVKFDHNRARFSLEGAHAKLECSRCHLKISENEKTFIKYKLENFRCADCHS